MRVRRLPKRAPPPPPSTPCQYQRRKNHSRIPEPRSASFYEQTAFSPDVRATRGPSRWTSRAEDNEGRDSRECAPSRGLGRSGFVNNIIGHRGERDATMATAALDQGRAARCPLNAECRCSRWGLFARLPGRPRPSPPLQPRNCPASITPRVQVENQAPSLPGSGEFSTW
jgi:hypothetical protein